MAKNLSFVFLKTLPFALLALSGLAAAQTVVSVNVGANRHPISPYIYGVAFPGAGQLADLNFAASRFGGNEASTYNWQENAQAKGNDWYFETYPSDSSSTPGEAVDSLVADAKSAGAQAMVAVPMLNYLGKLGANRSALWSFSISKYGAQTGGDPYNADAGNGISAAPGNPFIVNDVNDANTPNSVSFQQSWLTHLLGKWGASNAGGVKYYLMDNEPSIWFSTHRDVHPTGPKMSEIYNDYVSYAGAVRKADPNALICGPEEWGWSGYFYSGYDQQWGGIHGWNNLPDRSANGNMDFIPWLLQQLKNYQTSSGKQLLNVLSVHYYPQQGEFSNDDSAAMQAIRNRSTRSLWDPNYTDTSWIGSVVQLIPRLKTWVSTYYPGLQTAITEYNWGDEGALNGATTQADIMGIFGREGLDMSSRWTAPATGSPAYLAMKIYRNYDGKKSTFGDTCVSCSVPNPDNLSAFAAQRTSDGALTVMVVNKVTSSANVQINLTGLSPRGSASVWQIASASDTSIQRLPNITVVRPSLTVKVPAQSVTLLVIPKPNGVAR
jgi:hypothetical protein